MSSLNRDDETLDELYSSAWSRHHDGLEPSAVEFLADHPDASLPERCAVLLTDQLLRWRQGLPKLIGDYLAEHPSLADDPEAILKLVQGEFLARLETGETPDPDSYTRIFPGLTNEIRLQCEVNRWLMMPTPPGPSMSMATTVDYRNAADAADDGCSPDSTSGRPVALEAPVSETDFELVRPLGSGGMGEVYEAIQKSLRKRVALKLIKREALDSPGRVRRFFAEARAVARLRHPHIVGVHGIGRMSDSLYFLVMDLVEDGTTVASEIREGTVSFDRAAGLVATVAEAIEHAHSRGVIHRDLKPSNVLLDAEGTPHVTDFGLAKVFDAADPDNPQTTADRILGTPQYMAPEQADPARGPITPRTDVYALGGLLYALLTGKPPIQGDSLTAILTRVVSPEPVPSPRELRGDVPSALERICRTCLEKDAEKRSPSAGAVSAALRNWLANPEAEHSTGAAAGHAERATESIDDPVAGRSRSGWTTDRSLKDGRRTPSPGRWPAKVPLSAPSRRRSWAAGAGLVTLGILFFTVTMVRTLLSFKDRLEPGVAVPRTSVVVADAKPAPTVARPLTQSTSIKGKSSAADYPDAPRSRVIVRDRVPWPEQRRPVATVEANTLIVVAQREDPRASQNERSSSLAPPPDLIADWDVHVYRPETAGKRAAGRRRGSGRLDVQVYRPETDGRSWLDMGNVLDTPVAIRPGDHLKIRAKFREPVYGAVLAIDPDGSVRRLGLPADSGSERPTNELTIPSGVEPYVRLTDPGMTALVLLASHLPLSDPAGELRRAFEATEWRASRAEQTRIFDGQSIAPIRKTGAIEKTAGTKPFAMIGRSLKANRGLNDSRAVLFEVAAPK